MYRSLIYVSRKARTTLSPPREVDEIVSSARDRNAVLQVTGALVCTRTHFAQLLEGPPAVVDELMESIEKDPRHFDVTVLDASLIARRQLSNWSMAYSGDSTYVARQIEALLLEPASSPFGRLGRLRTLIVGFATAEQTAKMSDAVVQSASTEMPVRALHGVRCHRTERGVAV